MKGKSLNRLARNWIEQIVHLCAYVFCGSEKKIVEERGRYTYEHSVRGDGSILNH